MAELELGVFIFLNIVAIAGFYVTIKHGFGIVLLLSFVIFAGLALYSFGELQVVQTKQIPTVNATSITLQYNSTGGLETNATKTASVDGYSEKAVFINSDFNTIGYVYFLAAGVALTWFLKVVLGMFKLRRKVKVNYW